MTEHRSVHVFKKRKKNWLHNSMKASALKVQYYACTIILSSACRLTISSSMFSWSECSSIPQARIPFGNLYKCQYQVTCAYWECTQTAKEIQLTRSESDCRMWYFLTLYAIHIRARGGFRPGPGPGIGYRVSGTGWGRDSTVLCIIIIIYDMYGWIYRISCDHVPRTPTTRPL